MERFFQALGDNTRLRLLNLMGDQEICVCYFVEILGRRSRRFRGTWRICEARESWQARREGKWMHYRIVMPPNIGAAQVLRQTLAWLREDRRCRRIGAACRRRAAVRRNLSP